MIVKTYTLATSLLSLLLLTSLAACGGSGGSNADTNQLKGSVVKGPIVSAALSVRAVNPISGFNDENQEPLASTETDGSGQFTIDLSNLGDVLIGSAGGVFVDESDNNPDSRGRRQISLSGDQSFTVYRPTGVASVSITILSDVMTSRAFKLARSRGISFDNAFAAVRNTMTAAFGFDPLTTVAVNPLDPGVNASAAEIQYALTLGGLAVAANEISIRAGLGQMNAEVIGALLEDLVDGQLDGQAFAETISINNRPMAVIDLNRAIDLFRNNNDTAYKGVVASKPNQQMLAQEPEPNNSAPTISLRNNANLIVAEGEQISLLDLITVADAETGTENLRFMLIDPATSGDVIALVNGDEALSPNHDPEPELFYRNFSRPRDGVVNLSIAVVDEDNGAAFIGLPLQINGRTEANNDIANTLEDQQLFISVLDNDFDADDEISLISVTDVVSGVATIVGNQVSFQPDANFNGVASFSYSISAGANEASATVTINVEPVNDAPTISAIADQVADVGEPIAPLSFLVGDIDNDPATLVVMASSDNQNLLPDANIVHSGEGNNRQISLNPAPGQSGTANIALFVSDGEFSSTTVFALTVLSNERYVIPEGTGDCSLASPCGDIAAAINQAPEGGIVKIAQGTFVVVEANKLNLKPGVSVSGGWNTDFSAQDRQLYPTIVESVESNSGNFPIHHSPLLCAAGVGADVVVSGLVVLGSTAISSGSLHSVALALRNDCSAQFVDNVFNARGNNNTGNSFAVFVGGDAPQGPYPSAMFKNNYIYGGTANSLSIGVFVQRSHGTTFEANYIDGGNVFGGSSAQAIRTQSPSPADGYMRFKNNVIAAKNEAIYFNGPASLELANNTIYGAKRGIHLAHSQTQLLATNNILITDNSTVPPSFCVDLNSQNPDWDLQNNVYLACAQSVNGNLGAGGVDLNNAAYVSVAEQFKSFNFNYAQQQGLFLIANDGEHNLPLAQDLRLTQSAPCALQYGGRKLAEVVPGNDGDNKLRLAVVDGRCGYVESPLHYGDAISAGAFEFEREALYVSTAGDDNNDCLQPFSACENLAAAIARFVPGEGKAAEIRIAEGSYGHSAAQANGIINEALSLVGGYSSNFETFNGCNPYEAPCLTKIGLNPELSGELASTVLRCDGNSVGESIQPTNTLFAGLAISAIDNVNNAETTIAIELVNGCNANVLSNAISGGNGGATASQDSVAIRIDGATTAPLIHHNFIDGGDGTAAKSYGIYAANGTQPTIFENKIIGNSDTNPAAPNALQSHGVFLGSDPDIAEQTGFAVVRDNSISAGGGVDLFGIRLTGFGSLDAYANHIYGGVKLSGTNAGSRGVVLRSDGTVNLYNNTIHGGDAQQGGFAHALRLVSVTDGQGIYNIRNNTILSGSANANKSAFGVVFTNTNVDALLSLVIQNNIISATEPANNASQSVCFAEEVEITPNSVENNSLYNCTTAYRDISNGSTFNRSVTDLNNQPFAFGNTALGPIFVNQGDGFSESYDWDLSPGSPCEVSLGGLDGAPLAFGFNLDTLQRTRTDDGEGTGWSMGAYENDVCSSSEEPPPEEPFCDPAFDPACGGPPPGECDPAFDPACGGGPPPGGCDPAFDPACVG